MRVIATRTHSVGDINLIEEEEFVSDNEDLKNILLSWGWVKPYDDTKPLPPKGLVKYESISYPKDRFVIKDGNLYQSNKVTSPTWLVSEWDLVIEGI